MDDIIGAFDDRPSAVLISDGVARMVFVNHKGSNAFNTEMLTGVARVKSLLSIDTVLMRKDSVQLEDGWTPSETVFVEHNFDNDEDVKRMREDETVFERHERDAVGRWYSARQEQDILARKEPVRTEADIDAEDIESEFMSEEESATYGETVSEETLARLEKMVSGDEPSDSDLQKIEKEEKVVDYDALKEELMALCMQFWRENREKERATKTKRRRGRPRKRPLPETAAETLGMKEAVEEVAESAINNVDEVAEETTPAQCEAGEFGVTNSAEDSQIIASEHAKSVEVCEQERKVVDFSSIMFEQANGQMCLFMPA
jgi:hypothetical protein